MPPDDPDIQRGLRWLIDHQQRDGLWKLSYEKKKTSAQPAKADHLGVQLAPADPVPTPAGRVAAVPLGVA